MFCLFAFARADADFGKNLLFDLIVKDLPFLLPERFVPAAGEKAKGNMKTAGRHLAAAEILAAGIFSKDLLDKLVRVHGDPVGPKRADNRLFPDFAGDKAVDSGGVEKSL